MPQSIKTKFSGLAIILAIVAILLAGWAVVRPVSPGGGAFALNPSTASPLLKAMDTGTLVVGYGGYPPYTIEDPNTGKVTGLSVDLVNGIASQLKLKVVWKKFNWSTMDADLKRGDIDVIADPIFETIPRAREFTFTQPYAFVPTGVGVARKGHRPFLSIQSLNDPSVTVSVGQGLAEETFIRTVAPKATIVAVPVANDSTASANLVLTGRADVAILTLSDAKRVLAANPQKLDGLWMDHPPAFMPAGFALRLGDTLGAGFLNASIENLKYNGTLSTLANRYSIEADFSPN